MQAAVSFQQATAAKTGAARPARRSVRVQAAAYNGQYAEELVATANKIASTGKGILAMDESNATCGKRLESIGLENTVENRQAYRELLVTTPGLGQYISGAILFEETLFQNTRKGTSMVEGTDSPGAEAAR
ncbi:class I fructose-bisphosphate aldolase [Halomonas sp. JS92-SW72]|uniref:class I fructose-bisphosphate aldolase n=1 Tax=Halomonas sp. JS92-SW72 TaxID=2306583 RepID=UPI000E5B7802|nr:class I fructose-bisphosphate aldolase [Halomonas sp. JS92-SW72]AXY44102.1 fructose-bisphosphate aldolase class I [Halomonas sp. JS92-SW72]